MFTDIEGSTRLLKQLGSRYAEVLAQHRDILRQAAAAYSGREVDTQGDSFFFAFPRARSALRAAASAQLALAAHPWPDDTELRVRMGIHTGEPELGDERYVGLGVHRAARIGAVGHGGQILVSSATWEVAVDEPGEIRMRELGYYRLKDIDGPVRLFQLEGDGLATEFPPVRAERARQPRRLGPLAIAALAVVIAIIAAAVVVPIVVLRHHHTPGASFARAGASALATVDPSTGRLDQSVELSSTPSAVTVGAGSAWVTLPNQNLVVRVNQATDTVQQTISVGGGPQDVVYGHGFVWVANSLAGTVTQIDPRKDGGTPVAQIKVGNGPVGLAFGTGGLWVADSVDHAIVNIDPSRGTTKAPIDVDQGADAVAVGNGAVWALSESTGMVSRIDPTSGAVTATISVGTNPVGIAIGPDAVWVANGGAGTVSRIDPATNQVEETVPVGPGPSDLSVIADGSSLWVSNDAAGTVSQLGTTSGKVVRTVAVRGRPQAVAATAASVFVAVGGSGAAHRGGTLTFASPEGPNVFTLGLPRSLDTAEGYAAWELLTQTNDGLMTYDRTGGANSYRVIPDLAATYPSVSNGGRTYTFALRPGIHYSDGSVVQPADIRRGIERALELSGGQLPTSDLTEIVGAAGCVGHPRCDLSTGIETQPGSPSITFQLTAPDPDFLYKLASPIADAVPSTTALHAHLPLPATGPYVVADINVKAATVRLIRNPRFREWSASAQPDGYPDQIIERYNYGDVGAISAVEKGTADVTDVDLGLPQPVLDRLTVTYSSQLHNAPALNTVGLWMNTRVAPFNDIRVRRALNYAVDRNHFVALAGGSGVAEATCQILPPNINGYRRYCPYTTNPDADGAYHGPDLHKALSLVKNVGDKDLPVTVWFFDIPVGRRNGAYLVSVLKKLGYRNARLATRSHDVGNLYRPDRQAGVTGTGGDYPSASDIVAPIFTCASFHSATPQDNNNDAAFCHPRIDAQISRAESLQGADPPAASALWTQIDREITDLAPWVTLRNEVSPVLVSQQTGNYTFCYLSGGACLDQLWVR